MTFTIWPAIDLKAGHVVRLAEGDMARATDYGDDPAAQARAFAEAGATALHVVDLDGAFAGGSVNGAAVERIVAAFPGRVQLGGGMRSRRAIDAWLARGAARIVLGTAALADPAAGGRGGARSPRPHRRRGRCAWRPGDDARLGRDLDDPGGRTGPALRRRGRRGAVVHRRRSRRAAEGRQPGGDAGAGAGGRHPRSWPAAASPGRAISTRCAATPATALRG